MKSIHLLLIVMLLGAQPLLSHAQVYKWKDKDGSIRYTDTPPPSNIKQEAIGKKTVEPTSKAPLSAADPAMKVPDGMKVPPEPKNNAPAVKAEDAAAQIRQRNAEAEKHNKEEKEAEAKRKSENCKAAKANYETYNQGGRVYKMNEKGERQYMGDKDLADGKTQAQQEINENCS